MAAKGPRYYVPHGVLEDSRAFFRMRGAEGFEGTALWIGRPDGANVRIVRLFVPEQVAQADWDGAWVDLTPHAHYTLTDSLAGDERFYVRIHAHPREAYHSARDDENAILTHEGAISIVVPYFGRDPIELEECAIYRYGRQTGWVELSRQAIRASFRVTP